MKVPSYEERFQIAVKAFWGERDAQAERQRLLGTLDAGTRGAVTGGKHLDAVAGLVARVFVDAGIKPLGVNRTLPGFYRASKTWDVVVTHKESVVAIIELKSQVGSFGNNQNNRIEEMVGQSVDVWKATREGLLGQVRPWFGYLMLLEDHPDTRSPVAVRTAPFPHDAAFDGAGYQERYRIAFERLRLEGELDAACLAVTRKRVGATYPDRTMTFDAFASSIHARVTEIIGLVGD